MRILSRFLPRNTPVVYSADICKWPSFPGTLALAVSLLVGEVPMQQQRISAGSAVLIGPLGGAVVA